MKKLLSHFNLGDAYEIQARVLPAMLVVLPIAVLIAQIASAKHDWLAMVGWGAGFEIVLAILVSKIGHALGVRLQEKLETKWGGLPTHAWLRPSDSTHSEQQKKLWRKAVSEMSGLDIEKAIKKNDAAEVDRVIADAIMACRNKIRSNKKAELLQTYNIIFGFARNLAGMKWLALVLCFICAIGSSYGSYRIGFEVAGTIIQWLFFLIAGIYCFIADSYVRHCAIRYAEFFFSAVMDIVEQNKKGGTEHGV